MSDMYNKGASELDVCREIISNGNQLIGGDLRAVSLPLLLLLLVYAFCWANVSEAYAATVSDDTSLSAGEICTMVETDGDNIYLGSPDGKTWNARATIYNVTSGTATYTDASSGRGCIITLSGVHADELIIDYYDGSEGWDTISLQFEGDNVLAEGIKVMGTVSKSLSIYGSEEGASLRITNSSFGISASGLANSTTPLELSFSRLDVYIDEPETAGIYATSANLKLISGSLSVIGASSTITGIGITSNKIGSNRYGGEVLVYDGYELTIVAAEPSTRVVLADSMQNSYSSLKSICGVLPLGASFMSGGKVYTIVVDDDGYLAALPADGSTKESTVMYGRVIYDNVLYVPPEAKTAKVSGMTYKVLNSKKATVKFTKAAKNKKTVIVPSTVKIGGKKYNVVGIAKNAFKGAKAQTVIVKTKKLTKKSVKGCFNGAKKIKTVKVKVGSKKANKTYVTKYKKVFTKKNCGAKVTVE